MRKGLAAVAAGAALMSGSAFAGTAAAAPVTGSGADGQDATPEVLWNGQVRYNPDLKTLTVSHDPATGVITATVALWRAVAYDGNPQGGTLRFTIGSRFDASGDCVADTPGDPTVTVSFYEGALWDPTSDIYAQANFHGFTGGVVGPYSPEPQDWSTFSAVVAGDPSKNRAYKCVKDISLESAAADEARGFCLADCPPPPPPPPGGDRTAPSVRWVSPRDGQTISGIYAEKPRGRQGWHGCLVEARDNIGIDRTENLLDGAFHDQQIDAPFGCEWDTREVPDGRHTLTVVAYDRAGNSARSTITVTVRNGGVVPPEAAAPRPPAPTTTSGGQPVTSTPAPTTPGNAPGTGARLDGRIVGAKTLRAFARNGLRVRVACLEQCRASARLVVSRRIARRLDTRRTLAKGSKRLDSAGTTVIRLRPSLRVALRLLRRSRLNASLRVQATGSDGVQLRLQRRVELRR